jgi:hypothetical protein
MVWAALTIILMQGVIAALLLRGVNSFGAFTSALLRTHDANVRIHEHNDYLVEEINKSARKIHRASELISDRALGLPSNPPPDHEKSA